MRGFVYELANGLEGDDALRALELLRPPGSGGESCSRSSTLPPMITRAGLRGCAPPRRSWWREAVAAELLRCWRSLAIGMAGVAGSAPQPQDYPWAKRVAAAERFADGRSGRVSFAVVDESGRLRGDHLTRVHKAASVVKVMFMVALLREPEVREDALTASEKHLLGPMIKRSDNQAATAIYSRVGEGALRELAREAGMRHFTTQPLWGLSTITAAEQARFMYRLERASSPGATAGTRCTC